MVLLCDVKEKCFKVILKYNKMYFSIVIVKNSVLNLKIIKVILNGGK